MTSGRYIPPVAVSVAVFRMLFGRIRFPKDRVGRVISTEHEEAHIVFRELQITSFRKIPEESMTVLVIRFKFARFSPRVNRYLSIIPIPVIAGMPGLRQKTWTFCEETGYSLGIYQFESKRQIEKYRRSFVIRLLEKRSVPGTVSSEIFPGTRIGDYLESKRR